MASGQKRVKASVNLFFVFHCDVRGVSEGLMGEMGADLEKY